MMPENQVKKFITEERMSRLLPAILSSLALAFVVFIVAPLDIYGANYEELDFTVANFALFLCLGAVLSAGLVFTLMFCLPRTAYRFVFAFVLATALLFVIQQNFFNFDMNSLPGDRLAEESPSAWQIVLDTAVWLIVYGGAFFAAAFVTKKGDKGDTIKTVSFIVAFALLASQIASPIFIVVNSNSKYETNILARSGKTEKTTITTEREFNELASENNVYYFCIDRFDEDYAEKAYKLDKNVFSSLQGFTWYKDNISRYGHTFPGVANMLTMKEFNVEDKRADFLDNAYKNEDIPLQKLHDCGYEINIYTVKYYAFTNAKHLPQYIGNLSEATNETDGIPSFELAAQLTAFSLYRAAPLVIKQIFDTGSTSDANGIITRKGADGFTEWTGSNSRADELKEEEFSVGEHAKKFAFIHYDGLHDILQVSDRRMPSVLHESIEVVEAFIDALKAEGLYKDATIIITGDHSRPVNDLAGVNEPRRTALFVKPSGEDEGFKVSAAQTSHDDIWATIFDSEGIEFTGKGVSVTGLSETENRKRVYTWHTYFTGTLDEYDYEINGPSTNFANWKETAHKHVNKYLMS